MRNKRSASIITIRGWLVLSCLFCSAAGAAAQDFEAYYNYLGAFPSGETNWSNDAQGVANDDNNWFMTQTLAVWKIPVGRNLDSVSQSTSGVIYRSLDSYPELAAYGHFGDPDVYQYNSNEAYLVLPVENHNEAEPGALAILRCSDLSFAGLVVLTNADGDAYQGHDAGWCAVDSRGKVFSTVQHPGFNGGPSLLMVYAIDWNRVHNNQAPTVVLEEIHAMADESGGPLDLVTMQGGDFAPGDSLLYLISGFHNDDGERRQREGLHVLSMDAPFLWTRIEHSTNGSGHFNYYYNSDFTIRNEPEGLTIWDLDDGRAPGIRGQLHAFMSDNDIDAGDMYFYHYTNIIRVDPSVSCGISTCCGFPPSHPLSCQIGNTVCHVGTPICPFNGIGAALRADWRGAEIRIRGGTYGDHPTISTRARLNAEGGMVRIGG